MNLTYSRLIVRLSGLFWTWAKHGIFQVSLKQNSHK
jgi:hypothetical protein